MFSLLTLPTDMKYIKENYFAQPARICPLSLILIFLRVSGGCTQANFAQTLLMQLSVLTTSVIHSYMNGLENQHLNLRSERVKYQEEIRNEINSNLETIYVHSLQVQLLKPSVETFFLGFFNIKLHRRPNHKTVHSHLYT